jgi:RHS repeat-associated protein
LDPALVPTDQAKQSVTLSTYAEAAYTNAVLLDDAYRTPLPAESSTYELIQVHPDSTQPDVTNLFRFAELQTKVQSASDGKHDLLYENLNPTGLVAGEPYRRLIARDRTLYRPDDMGASAGNPKALLALGQLESLALPGSAYKLAFTPGLVSQVYQRGGTPLLPTSATVLASVATDGGGYVDLDGDGCWWIPSGRIYYLPTAPSSPQEHNQALQHCFLPRRFEDPFGNASTVDYDAYDLLAATTTDAVSNVVTSVNDYRVLAPALITDPNGNQIAVSFDALAMVAATAVMGKPGENLGDLLTGFSADLTQPEIHGFYNAVDPHTVAGPLLGNATTRVIYDVRRFLNSQAAAPTDPTKWQPAFAATLARETHVSDLAPGQQSTIQITFSYSDGYGREIQKKIQAEPGPVIDGGPVVNPRWVGSGWTIFNNKGKPVRQYEPFFSQFPSAGHQFEFGMQVGVSPILCYDPVQRVVATVQPNQTYEKVAFDPWQQATWDVNDTVLQTDPASDPDVGDYFQRLPTTDYLPTWYTQRATGGLGSLEQAAATKAAAHTNTPAIAYFDTLGRTFLTIADNAGAGKYLTHVDLDIQNYQRSITDAMDREVMAYDYDMPGGRIHQASMEAGERWMLNDVTGKTIGAWDSRGHNFRTAYDALRRPINQFVQGTDPINSDARTTAGEVLYEATGYGEGQPSDQALNLRTRIFQTYDAAGVVKNVVADPVTGKTVAFDFKGNLLGSSRQFVQNHKALPDWSKAAPAWLADLFISSTQYDALNRVVAARSPDGSVVHPVYNEANLLKSLGVSLLGAAAATPFVNNIDYNAKGQRVLIDYGDSGAPPASTTYTYDTVTFRLMNMTTARPGFPSDQQTVQNLSYTYDPVGNITHIQDDADIQNVVFFDNRRVEPSGDYTYDAIYRLIQASGREQLGLSGGVALPPSPSSYNDVPRIGLLQPGHGNAMGTYSEQYQYDPVGNFLLFIHRGADPANPGWTRSYTYNGPSLLEPAKVSNRLTRTTVSGNIPLNEHYSYDLHGNMTGMPQLQLMSWDFNDQLLMTQRQAVNASDQDGILHQGERTYYVYNAAGERVRKTTESATGAKTKERFYLGALEVYRDYGGAGTTTLERQTLHVMDDRRRIALVETKTVDPSAPPGSLPISAIRYQFDNHLGTACLELDDAGAVISYEEYYPYGCTSYQAGRTIAEVSLKRYRYTGKERDEETGLYYQGARYYAAWLGRWTSCDPSALTDGPNSYIYAHDRPTRLTDPNGLQSSDDEPGDAGAPVQNQNGTITTREGAPGNSLPGGAPPQQQAKSGQVAREYVPGQAQAEIEQIKAGVRKDVEIYRQGANEFAQGNVAGFVNTAVGTVQTPAENTIKLAELVLKYPNLVLLNPLLATTIAPFTQGESATYSRVQAGFESLKLEVPATPIGTLGQMVGTGEFQLLAAALVGPQSSSEAAETKFTFDGSEIEFKAEGTLEKFQPHANAPEVRAANNLSGSQFQSMHMFPQSAGEGLPQYSPSQALTRIGERPIHASLDSGWLSDARALAATGQTEMPASSLYQSVAGSFQQSPLLTQMEKNSLMLRLSDEMFVELGLQPTSPVRVPYSR